MNTITNHYIYFKANPKTGLKIAEEANNIKNYQGVKYSANLVKQYAKDNAWEFLSVPFCPYLWGVKGKKRNENSLHPLASLGAGAILATLPCFENIRNINKLNPKLKNTSFSQKRTFINDFNDSKSFNLKRSTISRLLKSKRKSVLKDATAKFAIGAVVLGAACLATEALCNIFWKKDKKS